MTPQRKFEIALFVAALALMAVFAVQWVRSREATIRAQDQDAATKQAVDAASAAIKSRDAAAAASDQQYAQQAAAVTTPQAAARVIYQYLPSPQPAAPGAPAPVSAPPSVIQAGDLTAQGQKDLPNAPGDVVLTPAQAEAQAKEDLACQATTANLSACAADKTDLQAQVAAETKASQAWEAAAKGGTARQRFLKVLKFAACSAGGAYIGDKADKSRPGTGAGIGAAAAVGACSFF